MSSNHSLLELLALTATEDTGAAGGDETDLLTRGSGTADGGRVANVLMVTTTVGMLDGIHRDTTHLGPGVALDLVLMEVATSLEDRLVEAATTGDEPNDTTAAGHHGLAGAGRQTDTGLTAILGMTDDDAGRTGGLGEVAAVTDLG